SFPPTAPTPSAASSPTTASPPTRCGRWPVTATPSRCPTRNPPPKSTAASPFSSTSAKKPGKMPSPAMSEAFVPLSPATLSRKDQPAIGSAQPAAAGNETPGAHATGSCAPPAVTLQRNGDVVTAIRVQCGCGQVIELNCTY